MTSIVPSIDDTGAPAVTRAAPELCVIQVAVSHHIQLLEEQLSTPLFRRLPRGLILTDEGAALVPVLNDSFDRMALLRDRFAGVALLPGRLFEPDLASGRLVQPFGRCVDAGRHWLTRLKSRPETPAMTAVKYWLRWTDRARSRRLPQCPVSSVGIVGLCLLVRIEASALARVRAAAREVEPVSLIAVDVEVHQP